jgi:hypothetical protein
MSVPLDGLQSFEYNWVFGVLQLDLHCAPGVNDFLSQAICSGICFLVQYMGLHRRLIDTIGTCV